MREEIYAGLKNAIEKGEHLEAAVDSFISAGYNPEEVKLAASQLTSGAISLNSSVQGVPNKSFILPVSRSENQKSLPSVEKPKNIIIQNSNNSPQENNSLPVKEQSSKGLFVNSNLNPSSLQSTQQDKTSYTSKEEPAREVNNPSKEVNNLSREVNPYYKESNSNALKVALLLLPILLVLIGLIILMLIFKDNVISFLRNLL